MTLMTKDSDYAIRALSFLAKHNEAPASVTEIAETLQIPYAFLRKIMQELTKQGILRSSKGKGGGFSLSRDPDQIYVADIIDIFQGAIRLQHCHANRDRCVDFPNCRLKDTLGDIEAYVQSVLQSVTLRQLIQET